MIRMLAVSTIGLGHFGIPYISPKTRIVNQLKSFPSFPIPPPHPLQSSPNGTFHSIHIFSKEPSFEAGLPPFLSHPRKPMYNPHSRLITPLDLKLLHLSARRQISETLPIIWHFPSETDVFGAGAQAGQRRELLCRLLFSCVYPQRRWKTRYQLTLRVGRLCGQPVVASGSEGLCSTSLSVFLLLGGLGGRLGI